MPQADEGRSRKSISFKALQLPQRVAYLRQVSGLDFGRAGGQRRIGVRGRHQAHRADRFLKPGAQVEHVLPALHLQRAPARFAPTGNLREARLRFERDYISAVLQHHAWRMGDAAQTLGIQRPNLYRKARQLGIPVTRISEQDGGK